MRTKKVRWDFGVSELIGSLKIGCSIP